MSETITPQAPDFLSLAKEGGKGVAERQKEWAARNAPTGTIPIVLTQAFQNETRIKAELASAEADIERGIVLTDRWKGLLRRRDLLIAYIKRGQELLGMLNDPIRANPALDGMIESGARPGELYSQFVNLAALPMAKGYYADYIEQKTAQLAQAQADIQRFAEQNGIRFDT